MTGKRISILSVLMLIAPSSVWAGSVLTFQPTPNDLSDLDHTRVYTWGIDVSLPPQEQVIAASLTFHQISNWDNNPNVLYVHLLDSIAKGVQQMTDNEGGGDYFASLSATHALLVTYRNLTTTPRELTYTFTPADLKVLNSYLADGRIGIGFDPDCHFYNTGVELKLVTPEPASVALLAAGALATLRRNRAAAAPMNNTGSTGR